jgi:hypothetical protein
MVPVVGMDKVGRMNDGNVMALFSQFIGVFINNP